VPGVVKIDICFVYQGLVGAGIKKHWETMVGLIKTRSPYPSRWP
jgi:hypothetical protein